MELGYELNKPLDDELLVRMKIEQARHVIMGSWIRFKNSINEDQLPAGFGTKRPDEEGLPESFWMEMPPLQLRAAALPNGSC